MPTDSRPNQSWTRYLRHGRTYGVGGLFVAVLVVVLALYWLWPDRHRGTESLTITGGSAGGLRHEIAKSLSDFTTPRGLQVEVVGTAGSRDALEQVNRGEIDLALTQGGLATEGLPNVCQVAVLHVEPLHLLVKQELLNDPLGPIHATRGRALNLSKPGSGTYALALDVLDFVGLEPGNDVEVSTLSYDDLLNGEIAYADLPDGVFTVSSLPSPVARRLIEVHGYRLAALPLANAVRLNWPATNSAESPVVRRRLVETTIPAFMYGVDPAVPEQPVNTIGARLQLVAHSELSPQVIERLVDAVYGTPFASLYDPPIQFDLLVSSSEFPLHAGAENYIQQKTPIITENAVAMTEQLLAIIATIAGGFLFLWQALIITRKRRRDRQFLDRIGRVVAIEEQALQYESREDMTLNDLVQLQSELSSIKASMLSEFQRGDIEGADALSQFIGHANDASEMVTRLILHERNRLRTESDPPATSTP